jgi:beta-glucanase (GH16 family)
MKRPLSTGVLAISLATLFLTIACNTKEKETTYPLNLTAAAHTSAAAEIPAQAICNYDAADSIYLKQGYTKVFEETFSSGLSQWETWKGGAYNDELQHYQAANIQVTGGNLVITAKKETVRGNTDPWDETPKTFDYTSGRIESWKYFSASNSTPKMRFVARIKLPAGYGMWPAFWTYGEDWPTSGEIDILEGIGQDPFYYTTDFWYGKVLNQELTTGQGSMREIRSNVNLTTCYHIYEVIWEKTKLTYLLDGKVVDTKTVANNDADDEGEYIDDFFGKQHRIALNLAVGGTQFGPDFDPSKIQVGTMYVDWVKVYTAK